MEIRPQPPQRRERRVSRPKVLTGNGDGTLLEPDFDSERFYDTLDTLTSEYLVKNFPEQRLRELCQKLTETLDRASKRLQIVEANHRALHCSHCQKPLPGGRFAGEIVIRSEITNELEALRACSEACYREISRIANERRQKHQGSIRGTVAL
jgi:hypothetical protein